MGSQRFLLVNFLLNPLDLKMDPFSLEAEETEAEDEIEVAVVVTTGDVSRSPSASSTVVFLFLSALSGGAEEFTLSAIAKLSR